MKVAIVQFPGSNCERETMLAVKRAGMTPIEFLWNESPEKLQEMDAYIIVGGFSYEDRSRAGIIAGLDPVMQEIKVQSELGKPVLGICNGAQILVETGLVPGLQNNQLGMALTENKRIAHGKILGTGFYNTWITMRPSANAPANAFTRHVNKDSLLNVPIAHAEGRFVMPDELMAEISQQGLAIFQYCDEQGEVSDNFPINPNGSMNNIAAVLNKAGNVMAMMPHPERTSAGDAIFLSMKDYILEKKTNTRHPERSEGSRSLDYTPVFPTLTPYKRDSSSTEMLVQLIITDNIALTVQKSLHQRGIPVQVKRLVHWQIDTKDAATIEKIKQSGILYNDRKEYLAAAEELLHPGTKAFLVRAQDDLLGQQKVQMLQDHFSIENISSIHHGILWIFSGENDTIQTLSDSILNTHIIANPYAHKVFKYE